MRDDKAMVERTIALHDPFGAEIQAELAKQRLTPTEADEAHMAWIMFEILAADDVFKAESQSNEAIVSRLVQLGVVDMQGPVRLTESTIRKQLPLWRTWAMPCQ